VSQPTAAGARPPIPTHVITGSLGVGKTTAIARQFAAKPEDEKWVVILNEFTESGIDVLTVAGQARGEFDVRLVPDGCLCCASELDFTRTLRDLVRGPRPARLFVEPSGIGHPAAIVETLLTHESHGAVRLESVVCLVDPARVESIATPGLARDQADVADVLLLSKAELATPEQRAAFEALAEGFYPPKRWVGTAAEGVLPVEALAPPRPRAAFAVLPARPADHAPAAPAPSATTPLPDVGAVRTDGERLGRAVAGWTFERRIGFARPALIAALERDAERLGAERIKGVFRTGPEHWALVQLANGRCDVRESSWRRDSRVEVLLAEGRTADWRAWDALWERTLDR
jgi:G3E family GTPase